MRRSRTVVSFAAATTMLTSALVAVAIPVSASPPASGPGALDTSFGINGSGVAGLARPAGAGALRALDRMVVQPDGKILVGALDATSHKTYVYRLTAGGIADSGFNGG